MNQTNLLGRLCQEPVLRSTESGAEVCSFTLAVTRKFKNPNNEYESDFINCVAFRNTAKLISQYVSKGDRLAITGRISTRNYKNNEGNKIYVTEVIVEDMTFLEPKKAETEKPFEEEKDPFLEMQEKVMADDGLDLPF